MVILFVIISLGVFSQSNITCRDSVKITYNGEIGIRELTGKNDGKDVEKYLKSVGLGKGYSWCAAFVTWVYVENGVLDSDVKYAWVPTYFPKSKLIYVRGKLNLQQPQSGDLIGIWFESKGRLSHIGFYDYEDDTYIYTVEGNTNKAGSRNGDGVYRKRRIKRQIHSIANWIDK